MKKPSHFLLYSISTFLFLTGTVYAQDAVKADPQHYKVEMENDFVRVLRITYGPGEQSTVHEHPKGVAVFLTDYNVEFSLPTGEVIPATGKKGQVIWSDGEKHQPTNKGTTPLEVIQVELKNAKTPVFDLETAKTEIKERNREFIKFIKDKDAAQLANLYTSDGQFMGNNMRSSSGKEAIQETFQNFLNNGIAKVELEMLNLWGDEKMVVTEDAWKIFLEDGTQVDQGKAIVIWKKEDGTWKMFRDIINSDLPVPSPN
ncbi:DUF4440 domain-containing protein [Antarcticibacterium arcticum]|uniref:DUF4440 domain-containing protein n=1 Tax=Antarcticibacterium arcticum TaxID=2585771 RepID=A0A5B8YES8_9FLAO|nr:DUF4440 domain-containing protein [Antarcticibacterium arcticum]QED36405.1 DUF4440 domain-containing protein [Antarcticibacterium arcticum]